MCRFAVGNLKLRIYKKSIISGIIINKLAHFRTYFDLSWMVPLSFLKVKKLLKGLKCSCCVHKGYNGILQDTV